MRGRVFRTSNSDPNRSSSGVGRGRQGRGRGRHRRSAAVLTGLSFKVVLSVSTAQHQDGQDSPPLHERRQMDHTREPRLLYCSTRCNIQVKKPLGAPRATRSTASSQPAVVFFACAALRRPAPRSARPRRRGQDRGHGQGVRNEPDAAVRGRGHLQGPAKRRSNNVTPSSRPTTCHTSPKWPDCCMRRSPLHHYNYAPSLHYYKYAPSCVRVSCPPVRLLLPLCGVRSP